MLARKTSAAAAVAADYANSPIKYANATTESGGSDDDRLPTHFNYLRYAVARNHTDEGTMSNSSLALRKVSASHDCRSLSARLALRTPRRIQTLHDVSVTMHGSRATALLYTSSTEKRALLGALTGFENRSQRVRGTFVLNGNVVSHQELIRCVAFVGLPSSSRELPTLTAIQWLRYEASLRPSTAKERQLGISAMIDQLLDGLALSKCRAQLLSQLSGAERVRLSVAAAILQDTEVLVLDDIWSLLDNVYDVCFLLDYVRDWAQHLGRIVVAAARPVSLHILVMFHQAVILASGRVVYAGDPRNMVAYFGDHGFACPRHKNPVDYFVDLVTLDVVSTPTARVESAERAERLAVLWRSRCAPPALIKSSLPNAMNARSSVDAIALCFWRFWSIFTNECVSGRGFTLLEPVVAFITSILLGTVIFGGALPLTMQGFDARLRLFHALVTYALWPLLICNICKCYTEKPTLQADLARRYYSAGAFIVGKLIFDVPFVFVTLLLYSLPVYVLCALQAQHSRYWALYAAFFVVVSWNALLWRYVAWTVAFAFRARRNAITALCAILFAHMWLAAPVLPEGREARLGTSLGWIRLASPSRAALHTLAVSDVMGHSPLLAAIQIAGNGTVDELMLDGCDKEEMGIFLSSALLTRKMLGNVSLVSATAPTSTVPCSTKVRGSVALAWASLDAGKLLLTGRPTSYFYATLAIALSYLFVLIALLLIVAALVQQTTEDCDNGDDDSNTYRPREVASKYSSEISSSNRRVFFTHL